MAEPETTLVRGRCACGKRFRIRNAAAGSAVSCPNCRRVISITADDIASALDESGLVPIQPETSDALEAIPIDHGELRLAGEGSRPGLTGGKVYDHNEAQIAHAMRGWRSLSRTVEELAGEHTVHRGGFAVGSAKGTQSFAMDLLDSFVLAGKWRNALVVLATALGAWLPTLLISIPMLGFARLLVAGIVAVAVIGYTVQFFWSVMNTTANGDDELSLFQADWDWMDDAIRPALTLVFVSVFCSLPAIAAQLWGLPPAFAARGVFVAGLLGAGWILWPMAVLLTSVSGTFTALRPDRIVRCILAVGPAYMSAVLAVFASLGLFAGYIYALGWVALAPIVRAALSVAGFPLNFYFGYVLFRNLGLIYRHFGARLPFADVRRE